MEQSANTANGASKGKPILAIIGLTIGCMLLLASIAVMLSSNNKEGPFPIILPVLSILLIVGSAVSFKKNKIKTIQQQENKRPLIITIMAWIMIILHGRSFILALFASSLFPTSQYIIIFLIITLLFVSSIGILKLKIWAIFSYLCGYISNILFAKFISPEKFKHLITTEALAFQIIVLVVIGIILYKYRKVFFKNHFQAKTKEIESV